MIYNLRACILSVQADGLVQYVGQPLFAVIAASHDLARHTNGRGRIVNAVGVRAQPRAVAQDLAATAAHVEHLHARNHRRHCKRRG